MQAPRSKVAIVGAGNVGSTFALVNRNGVEKFLRLELLQLEQEQLKHSAKTLKGTIKNIKL